jgi:hypothetical protein
VEFGCGFNQPHKSQVFQKRVKNLRESIPFIEEGKELVCRLMMGFGKDKILNSHEMF